MWSTRRLPVEELLLGSRLASGRGLFSFLASRLMISSNLEEPIAFIPFEPKFLRNQEKSLADSMPAFHQIRALAVSSVM